MCWEKVFLAEFSYRQKKKKKVAELSRVRDASMMQPGHRSECVCWNDTLAACIIHQQLWCLAQSWAFNVYGWMCQSVDKALLGTLPGSTLCCVYVCERYRDNKVVCEQRLHTAWKRREYDTPSSMHVCKQSTLLHKVCVCVWVCVRACNVPLTACVCVCVPLSY